MMSAIARIEMAEIKKSPSRSKLATTGCEMIGDMNWPRKSAVLMPPRALPRMARGAELANQTYRLG